VSAAVLPIRFSGYMLGEREISPRGTLMTSVRETAAGAHSTPTYRARREKIIREAALLFAREGYQQTNMERIAAAVGICKPTLYHYVKSKEEILYEVHQGAIDFGLFRQEERALSAMSPTEQLLGLMRDNFEFLRTMRAYARVLIEHHQELPDDRREIIDAKSARYFELVEDVVRKGIESGEFRPVDVRLTALALIGMWNFSYRWYRPGGPKTGEDLARDMCDLVVKGLLPEHRAAVHEANV